MWMNYCNIPATTRKHKHSAAASSPQRDRTPPQQMSHEILDQLGDVMGRHEDESKNKNQGPCTQLMHSLLHASSETSSLNKKMKLYALLSNLSKMTVAKMNEEVEITYAYQNNERFITTKEKALYSLQNYVAKASVIISQMTDAVVSDADARENGTSLNHKKVIQMGIHVTTLLSHIQAEMSQRRRNNIRSIVESQYVSFCGPKPGSKAAMQNPKNTDPEHLLGNNLKKAAKKAKTSNNMFKKSTNRILIAITQNLNFPPSLAELRFELE